jgi:hypothetical protein
METSDSSPNLPLHFLGNFREHRDTPSQATSLPACPGLILMYRFYKDVSHVELIIGESGLRPDPRASSTLCCFFSAIFGVPTMWEPLSTPKYGKPLRDQQISRYPLVNSQNYGKSPFSKAMLVYQRVTCVSQDHFKIGFQNKWLKWH